MFKIHSIKPGAAIMSALLIGFVVAVQGCGAKSIRVQDANIKAETRALPIRSDESLAVSYLAKELVSRERQQRTIEKFSKSERVAIWTAEDSAISAQMMGDVISGGFGSSTGKLLGSAVFIASLLGPDGSRPWIEKAYLPSTIDGATLDTAEAATQWIFQSIESKLQRLAEDRGWTLKCIHKCGENNSIYELNISSFPLNSLYKPKKIYVFTYMREPLQKANPDPLRDAATGMKVAWENGTRSSLLIRIIGDSELDSGGEILLEKVENENAHNDGALWPTNAYYVGSTKIGHLVLNAIYDSPYLIKGSSFSRIRRVFYNGKIYQWSPYDSYDGFVRDEVLMSFEVE